METAPITIMVVDDSIVVRGIVSRILRAEPDIEVISTAIDGVMAVNHARDLKPNIVILDIEMPNKDGLTALPEIIEVSPKSKVIMASTLTARNADISMKALSLGASDYLKKPDASDRNEMDRFSRELIMKIRALAGRAPRIHAPAKTEAAALLKSEIKQVQEERKTYPISYPATTPKALAIASSTGGPQALTTLFKGLQGHLGNVPIFITQHMPPTFTAILATNVGNACGMPSTEGKHGEAIQKGHIYVAPGDYHMRLVKSASDIKVKLDQGEMINFCRPAADPMIESLVEIYGSHLMLVVLTGMGHDGLAGAKILSQARGTIVAQDKETSVVWGMPKVVAEAGIASAVLPLEKIASYIIKAFGEVG